MKYRKLFLIIVCTLSIVGLYLFTLRTEFVNKIRILNSTTFISYIKTINKGMNLISHAAGLIAISLDQNIINPIFTIKFTSFFFFFFFFFSVTWLK